MIDSSLGSLTQNERLPVAVVLGTSEIASAVAVSLVAAGHSVILSHDPFPPVMRRAMAFHDALFGDPATVNGIEGERAETAAELAAVLAKPDRVAVTPLHLTDLIAMLSPKTLIDARMQKYRVTPDFRGVAALTIGLGPQFAVGINCDIAIETRPSKNGTIVKHGQTDAPDRIARSLGGAGVERFVYSDRDGRWHTPLEIGTRVFKGLVLGHHDGHAVRAPMDGVLRGLVRDSTPVPAGVKLLEIDPRGPLAQWTGSDERGRTIAEATVKAIRLHNLRPAMTGAGLFLI
jgi:hypothetical protein